MFGLFDAIREKWTGVPRLMRQSWRGHIKWTTEFEKSLRDSVENFKVDGDKVENLNVLLIGYSRAGKSSFYNSCLTAVKNDNRIEKAFSSGGSATSLTLRLNKTTITCKNGSAVKLNLFDCKGLHEGKSGILMDELYALIEGKIPVAYKFKESNDAPCSHNEPQLQNKMHCIVLVIDASKGAEKSEWFKETIEALKEKYNQQKDIQIAVLLTHVDRLRGSIGENIQHVFLSSEVKEKVDEINKRFFIDKGDILPMVNYFDVQRPTTEQNILALFNMLHIMGMANDYVKHIIPMETDGSN